MSTFIDVPVDRITPHDRNVRRDLGDLGELAACIKNMGVLQPLVVAPDPGTEDQGSLGYVLVAGHRRHAAAVKAGLAKVPCIVRDDLDSPAKVISAMLTENLQRTDLTVMEEADAYQQLELLGVKEAAIAKTTGRSRKTVHERLLLASLPSDRREQYETGKLSLDGAVACARLRAKWADDAEILTLIDKAGTWSFGGSYGVEARIKQLLEQRKRAAEPEPEPVEDDDDEQVPGQSTIDDQVRESAWEQRQAALAAEREAWVPLWKRQAEWLTRLLTTPVPHAPLEWGDLAVAAVEAAVRNYAFDEKLAALAGIDVEETEDGDARLRHAPTPTQAIAYCVLVVVSDAGIRAEGEMPNYADRRMFDARARFLCDAGYEPTDAEVALLNDAEAGA